MKVVSLVEVTGWKAVGSKLVDYTKSTEVEWEKNRKMKICRRNCSESESAHCTCILYRHYLGKVFDPHNYY